MNYSEIIQRHDQALAVYLTDVNQKAPTFIARERAPYVEVLNTGKTYYGYMSYVLDEMDDSARPHQPMVLYVQAAGALDGMMACLWNGSIAPAFSLLRTLFEIEITLALITEKDVEARSRLYSEYEYVGRWQNLQNMQELVGKNLLSQADFDAKYTPDVIKEIEDAHDHVKTNYNQHRPNHWAWDILRQPGSSSSWNPSLKSICSHLGRLQDYNTLYSILSMVAHAGSRSRVALSTADGMITAGPIYSERTGQCVVLGMGFAHKTLEHMANYLPAPKFDEQKLYSLHLVHRTICFIPGGEATLEAAKAIATAGNGL